MCFTRIGANNVYFSIKYVSKQTSIFMHKNTFTMTLHIVYNSNGLLTKTMQTCLTFLSYIIINRQFNFTFNVTVWRRYIICTRIVSDETPVIHLNTCFGMFPTMHCKRSRQPVASESDVTGPTGQTKTTQRHRTTDTSDNINSSSSVGLTLTTINSLI